MSDRWFVKKPCKHCPFRTDVTPFLHPERADEIASAAQNPYSQFHCHATIDYDDNDEDREGSITSASLQCAGFLAMQINEAGAECPKGFSLPENTYDDYYAMTEAYQIEWDDRASKRRARRK